MSKLKVPDIVPSIVVDTYEDMYDDNPMNTPSTATTSSGGTLEVPYEREGLEVPEEDESAIVPIKMSMAELHDMVTKMMMQRYGINPNQDGHDPSVPPITPTSLFARRASHVILEVPASIAVGGLKKITHNKNMGSMSRETAHFCGITTVHGPNRVYNGKGFYRYFWLLAFVCCLALLSLQIGLLIKDYLKFPISTETQLTMATDGLTFPTITICNYNAIRRSYIEQVNQTHYLSNLLLYYITLSNLEIKYIKSINNESFLEQGNIEFFNYTEEVDGFTTKGFYDAAGLTCQDTLKICSFGGREFDCCEHATPVLTDMGKCFRIQLDESPYEWLHKQKQSGINNGLQIIADVNTGEQLSRASIYKNSVYNGQPIFANQLTDGLRFYVHIPRDLPHLVGDGVSVTPGALIYSSITPQQYTLLAKDSWGNCIEDWPKEIALSGEYSSARCQAYCRAQYFNKKCGCSPFVYDLDEIFTPCTPYKLYECIKNDTYESLESNLQCAHCGVECTRWAYSTSNSYELGFSPGAIEWLIERNSNLTEDYINKNYVSMNIYYKELVYSHIQQNQGSNLVVLLSNIGGNMGMFNGMSVLSCCEVLIFLSKISWILFSKKRRDYLKKKKDMEKEREQKLEETLKNIKIEAEQAAEDNENRLTETMMKIQRQAVEATKQHEEEARQAKEKSIFSRLPIINKQIHPENEEFTDV